MFFRDSLKKKIAGFLLVVMVAECVLPLKLMAITGGPAQPEMTQFQPSDSGDLVDLFTGDFKYNIPLGDLDGYPLNLAYQSGAGIDDEASWVGLGWTFNPGSLTRTVRGLPDDFDGTKGDEITREFNKKDYVKTGGQVSVKASLFGNEVGKAGVKVDVYKDNYFGIGASVGADISYNLANSSGTSLNAGLGMSVDSDVRNGVSVSPSFSLERSYSSANEDLMTKWGLSGGFTYNTRGGLLSTTLGTSFDVGRNATKDRAILGSNAVSYFGQTYTPKIQNNSESQGYTFSFDIGPKVFGVYAGFGGAGYRYTEKVKDKFTKKPAFGYLNYHKARQSRDVLLDFNREKDGPFILSSPAIASPVATYDLYTVATHLGSHQFRPFYNGNYAVFDNKSENNSHNTSAGLTIGAGNLYQGGARLAYTYGESSTGKWSNGNGFFYNSSVQQGYSQDHQMVSFRSTYELTDRSANGQFYDESLGSQAVKVAIQSSSATNEWRNKNNNTYGAGSGMKFYREPQTTVFSYLTNAESLSYGLNKGLLSDLHASDSYRKDHHIGEVTVTQADGSRFVFGLPVYNIEQREVSFSKAPSDVDASLASGLLDYSTTDASMSNTNLRDHFFSREITPAYSTSHLLTGILSPDYNDITGNGISEDDPGTAISFTYDRHTKSYRWRTPFGANKANYNEGFQIDPKDDRGNYVFGQKEVWYLKTIESKTMVAVMHTSDRTDAFGVANELGAKGTVPLKKLDKIVLYRKFDWIKKGEQAVPVKTIHFTYEYLLHKGIPNQSNSANPTEAGKLTLTKVHFTYGKNTRAALNPYEFTYDLRLISEGEFPPNGDQLDAQDMYQTRRVDRWGTYKQPYLNKTVSIPNSALLIPLLNNSAFPYTLQQNANTNYNERDLVNRFASKWQLNSIKTPTGSLLTVEYESDDYTYVQNRRAMQMCFISGIGENGGSSGLIKEDKISIELPMPVVGETATERWNLFKKIYLTNERGQLMEHLFYKFKVNLVNYGNYEYVHGYARIDYASSGNSLSSDGKTAVLSLKKVDGYNPIAFAGWQLLKTSLPQFAYDNYDNSEVSSDVNAAIRSIIGAIKGMGDLFQSYPKTASAKKFCDEVSIPESMVRLMNPGTYAKDYAKLGGGARVKKVVLDDLWMETMQGLATPTTAKSTRTGKLYEYVVQYNGQEISSGVASYEPIIGNEENPFREPIPFTEKVHLSQDKFHFIEKPFCEAYFPAPVVGYSAVKITSLGEVDVQNPMNTPVKELGWTVSEFYTLKDFPTIVDFTPIDIKKFKSSQLLKLFASSFVHKVGASQGFVVELNDMHGKPKATRAFSKSGDPISYTEFYYVEENPSASIRKLKSNVQVVDRSGQIRTGLLGEELDLVSDHRESNSTTLGSGAGVYVGGFTVLLASAFFAGFNPSAHYSERDFRSVSVLKCIHRSGILKKVVTMENGSTIEAENLLFDANTGAVVLRSTQNEFEKNIYSLVYPAYWAYDEMGSAFQNNGVIVELPPNSSLVNYSSVLVPGDELYLLGANQRAWVIKDNEGTLKMIDENGEYVQQAGFYAVKRSGRRNLLNANVSSIVMLTDPRIGGQLNVTQLSKILNTEATVYREEWDKNLPPVVITNTETSVCNTNPDCFNEVFYGMIKTVVEPGRRALLARESDNLYLSDLGIFFKTCNEGPFNSNAELSEFRFYKETHTYSNGYEVILPGDRYIVGDHYLVFDQVNSIELLALSTSPLSYDDMGIELASGVNNYNKYCYFANGNCSFSFRRTIGCSYTPIEPENYCPTDPNCNYSNIASFHLEPIPVITKTCETRTGIINPYLHSIKGDWHPWLNYVYHTPRVQPVPGESDNQALDLSESGYYANFSPFWTFNSNGLSSAAGYFPNLANPTDTRWIWTSANLAFDYKGNNTSTISPTQPFLPFVSTLDQQLGATSSTLFGYGKSRVTAVGANAPLTELMYDGFEDYDFDLTKPDAEFACDINRHFDWGFENGEGEWQAQDATIKSGIAHSGSHSLQLNGVLAASSNGYFNPFQYPSLYIDNGLYTTLGKINRFSGGQNQVFSCWIKETSTSNTVDHLTVTICGQQIDLTNKIVPVVDGWKKLEFTFVQTGAFTISFNSSGTVYLDDIRMFPEAGSMKSFVFEPYTLRLVAELDENNFAQYFEYDESGTVVRVKKETEKGVVTVKENRQYIPVRQ